MSDIQVLTPEQSQRLLQIFKERIKSFRCPICKSNKFNILDGLTLLPLQNDNKARLPKISAPSMALICSNCGFTSLHNLGVLESFDVLEMTSDNEISTSDGEQKV